MFNLWMEGVVKQFCSKTILVFFISISLLITACTSTARPTRLPTSPTGIASSAQTTTGTSVPAETPTLQVLSSPTPAQEEINFLPTTFEQPGAWELRHPYSDPDLPKLITLTLDGYQLDPDFEVASVELSYRWIGIGDTVHDYQRIDWREGGFWQGDKQISAEAVDKLVQAVAHLSQEPKTLTATVWTDDYPFWAVELTSFNGDKILLYSNSNSSSYIPWNVIFNGEIYTQYDGAIPSALDGLFTVIEGRAIAFTCGDCQERDLPAATFEPPPAQITEGFNGLLPIYHDFSYYLDVQKGELRGYLSDSSWTSWVNGAEINWLTGLQAVDLDIEPGKTIACGLANMPTDDPKWVYWKFNCPVGNPGDNISYRYPIRMTYATSTGQPYILTGELFGYCEPAVTLPVIPYPAEIGAILESSPLAGDLLHDHLMYVDDYSGSVDATTGVITHEWNADVVLLGQAQVGERIVHYTVKLDQVEIEEGTLVHWDLDRPKLGNLLKEVVDQTVTKRFLEYDPQGVINLYYAEYTGDYTLIEPNELPACAYLPQGTELPQPGQPVRGFGFNLPPATGFYDMQIVFMDDSLRVFQLDLSPASAGDAYWMSVMPDSLKPQISPPFTTIHTRFGSPDIIVEWNEQTSPADVSYYESMFMGWDVVRLTEYTQGLRLNQRWFDLAPDGGLILLNCQAP